MKRANSRGGWSVCARWLGTVIGVAMATGAIAQPGNPGPGTFVDMGSVGLGANVYRTAEITTPGGYVWFKFTLTETIDPRRNWLELDMSGPTTLANPDMAVYDARANRLFTNNDSGGSSGTANTGWAPGLSIGGGSGLRLSRSFGAEWDGGRISIGSDSSNLGAGTYWVGVAAWDAAFVDPNPTWSISSTSVLTGSVGLRVTTGAFPASWWNEERNSNDAGEYLDTAQVVSGTGPLTNILCAYQVAGRDMFKIRVVDGTTFSAVARVSGFDGGQYQTKLFLFDGAGRGVYAINGTTNGTDTMLTRPDGDPPLPAGEYFLAISSECGGYSTGGVDYGPAVPFSATNEVMWDFTNLSNQVLRPTVVGAAAPLSYWGRQADCENPNGYHANITLTGAAYIENGPASCVADTDDGSGTGTPDQAVTIDDLLYFLERFGGGC